MSLFERRGNSWFFGLILNHGNSGELSLPRRQVGDNYLAWLEPRDEVILEIGVLALADLVIEFIQQTGVPAQVLLLTPPSGKSKTMMELVFKEIARRIPEAEVDLFDFFSRDSDREKLEQELGTGAEIIEYKPITKSEPIYLGISAENIAKLKQLFEDKPLAMIIDDVFSTGETVKAIRKLIEIVIGQESKIPALTLALELFADENFADAPLHLLDKHGGIRAAGKIPVEPVDITTS